MPANTANIDDLRANIEEFIEHYYNRCRLALGAGLSDAGGVRSRHRCRTRRQLGGATVSFSRHGEIYRSDVRVL